jgi:hypothetical protein
MPAEIVARILRLPGYVSYGPGSIGSDIDRSPNVAADHEQEGADARGDRITHFALARLWDLSLGHGRSRQHAREKPAKLLLDEPGQAGTVAVKVNAPISLSSDEGIQEVMMPARIRCRQTRRRRGTLSLVLALAVLLLPAPTLLAQEIVTLPPAATIPLDSTVDVLTLPAPARSMTLPTETRVKPFLTRDPEGLRGCPREPTANGYLQRRAP